MMYIYNVPVEKFDTFHKNLKRHVYRDPMDVTYNCDIKVNSELYRLRFQLFPQRQLLPLQAIRMDKHIEKCELIRSQAMLGALTELVVAQYAAEE